MNPNEIPKMSRKITHKIEDDVRTMARLHYLPLMQDPKIAAHVELWGKAGPGVKQLTFPAYLAASLKGWPYTMTFDDETRAPKLNGRRIPFPITAEQEKARRAKLEVKKAKEGAANAAGGNDTHVAV